MIKEFVMSYLNKIKLVLCFLLFLTVSYAQNIAYDYLDFNQIKARVNSNGALFHDETLNYYASFEVPKGMDTHTIFVANLWVAGIDENGELRAVGPQYFNSPENYYGPVANNYETEEYQLKYNNVWKVDVEQIEEHIINFSKSDYVMPESFKNWPAEGNVENGEAAELAPYYDDNHNGKYDPENGDFPAIKGDYAVYYIYNEAQEHYETEGDIMGLEFHGMLYGFNSTVGNVLTETVFLSYQIINRSEHNYTDVYAGLWTDFELGFGWDDVFGSDSINQMMYVYNATNEDAIGAPEDEYSNLPYGSPCPVQGVVLLNSEVYASIEVKSFSNATAIFNYTDSNVYNFLRGLNPSNFSLQYNGEITTFYQSGYPELGTGWIYDIEQSYGAGKQVKGLISAGPYTLNKNEKICLDFALPYARDYQGTNLTALSLLRQKASLLLEFYEENNLGCDSYQTDAFDRLTDENEVSVYPNPSDGYVSVDLSELKGNNAKVFIYSSDGKLIEEKTSTKKNELFNIAKPGVYLFKVETSERSVFRRVIVM